MALLPLPIVYPTFFLLLFYAAPIHPASQSTILWAAPAILGSALMIAWAAESAQFFIAQGFALAILAWLQTLPEFAVEAVIAYKQQKDLLLANLTGALRLLTGFGWPMIYFTAAMVHRRRHGTPLRSIKLDEHHAAEVIGLLVSLIYTAIIVAKGTLTIVDAAVLIAIYAAYLFLLSRLPAESAESVEDLEAIPRAIVKSPRFRRIAIIAGLFAAGGALIYFSAEPFLASLLSISAAIGVPTFFFVQWVAPVVSEFPEMASTFYWARTVVRAPMALMNMVSSNVNQWTLLAAMLPIVFSMGAGHVTTIQFDKQQRFELLMTLGQALLGVMFLMDMELAWWEAAALFVLFAAAFVSAAAAKVVTVIYFVWTGAELYRMIQGRRDPLAMTAFARLFAGRGAD